MVLRSSLRNQKSNWPLFNIRNDSNPWMVNQDRFRILKPPVATTCFLMGILNEPTINGRTINRNPPLCQHVAEVCVAHWSRTIPPKAPKNDFRGKVFPFEFGVGHWSAGFDGERRYFEQKKSRWFNKNCHITGCELTHMTSIKNIKFTTGVR